MATTSIAVRETPLLGLLLGRADDALVLGHRLSEWCGHAPMLEEDLALANLALDLVGQARALYAFAAEAEDSGHDEDDFAYRRDARAWRNLLLLEQPNGDFAMTIVRHLLYSAFIDPWWRLAVRSTEPRLAEIAAKAEKESAYHLRHASDWLIRLGDGTDESHLRAQAALDWLWPYTGEMFDPECAELVAAGICPDPPALRETWDATVSPLIASATLKRPPDAWMQTGGRAGRHGEHLGYLLAELQYLQRSFPGGAMVDVLSRAWDVAARIPDPEIPALTIADLGVLRDVSVGPEGVEVTITPTYSGCPAMTIIALDIAAALEAAGIAGARVRTVLSPAWTTDWMSEAARRKLAESGIAPPRRAAAPPCPRCASERVERLSEFGSTACKSLWRCLSCREPFDAFKCH